MSADPVGINGDADNKLNESSKVENVSITVKSPSSKSEVNSTSPKDAKAGDNTIVNHSPEYQKLIEYGLDDKVATRLEEIYKTGSMFLSFEIGVTKAV